MNLNGKVIAITRPKERTKDVVKLVKEAGGVPFITPTLKIKISKTKSMIRLCENLDKLDWLIFTSPAAVESLFKSCENVKKHLNPKCKIAVIGPRTKKVLEEEGLKVDVISSNYTAEGLLEALSVHDIHGKVVGMPRTLSARDVLPKGLTEMGARVYIAEAYKSLAPDKKKIQKLINGLLDGEIDAITFTSPLTVENLFKTAGEKKKELIRLLRSGKVLTAAIGPITAEKLKEYGVKAIIPEDYTIKDMMMKLFSKLSD